MAEAHAFLQQGGWPMIPLGLFSLAALTIIIERTFALRRAKVFPARVLEVLDVYHGETSAETAIQVCQRSRGALARIIEAAIGTRHLDYHRAIESVNSAGRREVGFLERGLLILQVVAEISPLMGLLGTVLGMVSVFDAITAGGIGDPQVLADGISKALITTVTGLCVAIPALAFHSFFSRRVETFATEMQDVATGFVTRLHELRERQAPQSDPDAYVSSTFRPRA